MKEDTLVLELSIRVKGISDPDGSDATDIIEDISGTLKSALEGWDWAIDEVYIQSHKD